jgi:hypothetical protein
MTALVALALLVLPGRPALHAAAAHLAAHAPAMAHAAAHLHAPPARSDQLPDCATQDPAGCDAPADHGTGRHAVPDCCASAQCPVAVAVPPAPPAPRAPQAMRAGWPAAPATWPGLGVEPPIHPPRAPA